MSARRFFRCADCLSVVATDDVGVAHSCGACDGALEAMGYVVRASKGATMQCACDARCVFAHGPNCDCKCEGANHGSGMVVARSDAGFLRPRDAHRAREKAGEWRSALVDFNLAAQKLPDREKRRARNVLLMASRCRVHRLRMSYLRDFPRGDRQLCDVLELDLGVVA